MKKIFTLAVLLMQSIIMLATAPTVPASAFVFSNIDGTKFSIRFTSGNGASRIVVMKAGGPILGTPVNGAEYTANPAFGTPASLFTSANEYVVYKGTSNAFGVTNLQPNTVYHLAVFEYNGTGLNTEYLQIALTGTQATVSAPTSQANTIAFSNITGNSVKLTWAVGNGTSRLVLARKGAAVNASPVDLTNYTASGNFGEGAVLNTDNYVVYRLTGNNVIIDKLEPNTPYHFSIFEKNGDDAPMYLRPGAAAGFVTNAGPTTQTQSFSFSSQEGNRFTVNTSRGNGGKRLYIVRKGAPVTASPVNGVRYTANAAFGSGQEIATGEYVFLASNLSSITLTNLEPATTYHFRSFEYDEDAAGNTYYLLNNPAVGSYNTSIAPPPPTSVSLSNVTGNSLTINYSTTGGAYRMVIMKEGSPVDVAPQDLIRYNGNGSFGNGQQLGAGNYVINDGANGSAVNVINLRPGFTYHIAVFQFNGNNYPVYSTTATLATIAMPAQPTTASSAFFKNFIEGNAFRANWTNGDGTRRIVIARKNAVVTAWPTDGVTYTANANFGQGTAIMDGQYVVYDGTGSVVDLKNLEINTTYHLAVFEYNLSGTTPDYLVSSFLAGNATTLTAPTGQVSAVTASTIQSNQVTINFTNGNGNGRIFIMREGSAVNTDPVDLASYSYSSIFGNQEIGTGNHIVYKTTAGGPFTVTGLNPSTQYYVAAYEYNGSNGPVFKKPAFTMNFTTAAGSGTPAPTVAASAPVFSQVEGNKLTFTWTNGNGSNRILVGRMGQPVNFTPANATDYIANASFGAGTDLGNGQFVLYNSSSSQVAITGLLPATTYHFAVFEYNGTGAAIKYLMTPLAASSSTLSVPNTGSSGVTSTFTNNSITLNWVSGTGSSRMVVMKEGGAVNSDPVNLSAYPASNTFGNGSQTGVGEYVVYSGNGSAVTVTGLLPNRTYHYKIIEFNGNTGPVYNTAAAASGNVTIASTLPVTWLYFRGQAQQQAVKLEWGTSAEQNSAYFVIERSNGQGFASIDTIVAAGNSNTDRHYSYTDAWVPAGNLQYRLKQVDVDGRSTYSQVITIRSNVAEVRFSVFPNPASASIKIRLQDAATAQLSIVDGRGALVQQQKVNNNSTIDISRLTPGIYYITVESNGTKYTEKLIKQ